MIFVGPIILAHLVGDYLLQNEWMAREKTRHAWVAALHGLLYALPFVLITQSPWALLVIGGTHAIIDHYRLARYWMLINEGVYYGPSYPLRPRHDPPSWVMIVVDNVIHLLINLAAVIWL